MVRAGVRRWSIAWQFDQTGRRSPTRAGAARTWRARVPPNSSLTRRPSGQRSFASFPGRWAARMAEKLALPPGMGSAER